MQRNYPHVNGFRTIKDIEKFVSKFKKIDYDGIHENVFKCLKSISIKDQFLNSILNVCMPYLLINITNFIFSNKCYPKDISGFNFKKKIPDGERSLGGNYLPSFYDSSATIIKPYIQGLFYPSYKEKIKSLISFFIPNKKNIAFAQNNWLIKYLKINKIQFVKSSQDYFWKSSENPNIINYKIDPKIYSSLKNEIFNSLITEFGEKNLDNEKLDQILNEILNFTCSYYLIFRKNLNKKKRLPDIIFTGTSGWYLTKIILENLNHFGVETFATLHSGSIAIFDYKHDDREIVEFLIPKNFIVANSEEVSLLKKRYCNINMPTLIPLNDYSYKTKKNLDEVIVNSTSINKIVYISPNFSG